MYVPKMWPSLLMVVLAVAGCSDPKAPSESNFKKALMSHFVAHPYCSSGSYPMYPNLKAGEPITAESGKVDQRLLDLQANGDLDIKEIPATPGNERWGPRHIITVVDNGHWITGKGFCLGIFTVEKVTRWSEPAPAPFGGVTISRVSYERQFKAEKWVPASLVKSWTEKAVGSKEAILVQMNDGWKVPDDENLY